MENIKIKKLKQLKVKKERTEKAAANAKQEYEDLRLEILGDMNREKLESLKSNGLSLSVTSRQVVNIEDWEAYYKYIHRYKAYDLLQKRIASRAVLDRIEDGKKVPGIKIQKVRQLNIRSSS